MENRDMKRTVESGYLKKSIWIDDNCGCPNGGYFEKEFTHHFLRGAKQKIVKIYCDQCNSELPQIIKPDNQI